MKLEYFGFSACSNIVNQARTNIERQVAMAPKILMVTLKMFFVVLPHDASEMRKNN
jgi:hypothetical protein